MSRTWLGNIALEQLDEPVVMGELVPNEDIEQPLRNDELGLIQNFNQLQAIDAESDQLLDDIGVAVELKSVATESLASGGMSVVSGQVVVDQLKGITNRWNIPENKVAVEGFLDDQTIATEGIIDTIKETLGQLVDLVSSYTKERARLLKTWWLKLRNAGTTYKKMSNDMLDQLESIDDNAPGMQVRVLGNLVYLQQGGDLDPEYAVALSGKNMDIQSMGERFRAMFANNLGRYSILQIDDEESTINFLKPFGASADKAIKYAMPLVVQQTTPIVGYALPGNVYVAACRHYSGLVETDFSYNQINDSKVGKLNPLDKETATRYCKAAFDLGDILETRMSDFISNSEMVVKATNELKRLKDMNESDRLLLAQARLNVKAMYSCYEAVSYSLNNSCLGLLEYVSRSMVIKTSTVAMR